MRHFYTEIVYFQLKSNKAKNKNERCEEVIPYYKVYNHRKLMRKFVVTNPVFSLQKKEKYLDDK